MAVTWSPRAVEALGARSAAARVAFNAFAAVFVAALGWHVAGINGAFLCDDYGNLNAVFSAAERGALWSWVFSLLHQPLGNASNAFRPMQYVSSALDWLAFGPSPIGWRASSITLFFGNAVVGGFVARRWLRGGSADAATGGILAACLLAAYPFAGEVAYYPGGRADLLACLFSLLYLWTLPVEGSSTARSHVLRIAWFLCALLSKESAALMAAVATMLCFATTAAGGGAARIRLAVFATVRETWPSWLTLGVYLVWRGGLFDSVWKVYVASTPPRDVSDLLDRIAPFRFLVKENVGPHYALWAAAAIALFASMLVLRHWERGAAPARQTAMIVALGCSAAMYFVAPAISFPVSGPSGEGARHFYPAWMCMSLLCGMLLPARRWGWAPALVLVLAMFAGQAQSLAQWRSAAMAMKRVVASIEGFVAGVRDEQYALLLLPDHRGIALFARNAQGGLVVRPTQRRDYASRMTVMLGSDFEPWSQHLTDGVITKLKYGAAFDPSNFLGLYCWNPSRGSIVPLTSGAVALDARAWRQEAERNFAAAGCLTPFF